jgi:hypothetical protein
LNIISDSPSERGVCTWDKLSDLFVLFVSEEEKCFITMTFGVIIPKLYFFVADSLGK